MTKRLYLTNSAPEYTPATLKGAWDDTTQTVVKALLDTKSGANASIVQADGTATTSDLDFFMGRWILNDELVLRAASLTGSATLMLAKLEANSAANHRLHVHMWVTQGNSDTVRGTLVSDFIHGTENPTTQTAVSHALTLSPVNVQLGDRIVLELGYRVVGAASSTSYNETYRYGGTDATDLAAGTTGVTTRSPWIEFTDPNGVIGPLPKRFTDLVDDFNDNSINTSKWTNNFGTITETGNRLQGSDSLATLQSDDDYFYPGPGTVVLAQMGPPSGSSQYLQVVDSAFAGFMQVILSIELDLCTWRYEQGGVEQWQDFVAGGYDATAHAWIRLRDDGTNSYFDTSPDGINWTQQFSRPTPATLQALTYCGVGSTTGEGGTFSGTWWVDNFNNPPVTDDGGAFFAFF